MVIDPKKQLVDYWIKEGIIVDKRLIKAFEAVPREDFISPDYVGEAYGDYPLPIGYGQTISQPSTIMIMTEALELRPGDKVLEIGTGCGYQAAILAKMAGPDGKVITTEIIPELAELAKSNLERIYIKNVEVIPVDGSGGFPAYAPYDRIIVTAACPEIPHVLVEQLKEEGVIVAPVGPLHSQQMIKARKEEGKLKTESLGFFIFVPLRGKYGFRS